MTDTELTPPPRKRHRILPHWMRTPDGDHDEKTCLQCLRRMNHMIRNELEEARNINRVMHTMIENAEEQRMFLEVSIGD